MLLHRLPPSPSLFALIIGINEYESTDVRRLSGAVLDADAVQNYLHVHLGVPSSQIKNLRNSDATRAAIIDEINAFSLNDEIKMGDPILIYYAGHGGSTVTPSGLVDGSTGKINFLIPYDYLGSFPLEVNLKHVIPNRTLGTLLSQLAIKKGDNIVRQTFILWVYLSTNYVIDRHPRLFSFRFWHTKL
jgi:hypothetical protein